DPSAQAPSAPSGTPRAPNPPDGSGTEPARDEKNSEGWEAPPGQSEQRPSRAMHAARNNNAASSRGMAKSYKRSDSGSQHVTDPGQQQSATDVPAWDAPPGSEAPNRHRSNDEMPRRTGSSPASNPVMARPPAGSPET